MLHSALSQEAVLLEARMRMIQDFRRRKKQDWKAWIQSQLQQQIDGLRHAKGSDLHRILRPKRINDAKKGRLRRHLPGFKDQDGVWRTSRQNIATAWQAQFAAIEHADQTSLKDLLSNSKPRCHTLTCSNLLELPTVLDLERAIRALRDNKAPGLDGLGAELLQGKIGDSARRLYPLVVKMFARQQGIVEHTGGWLVPLWKRKGSMTSMSQYRAILLESTVARAVSKAWRPWIAHGVEQTVQPLQYGGRKGLAIEALHLQTRLWQANAKKLKCSLSIIFVDIQSAFYTVVKQMIASTDRSHEALASLFQRMGMPHSALEEFIANVGDGDTLKCSTGPTLLANGVAANLSHTWFAVQNGDHLQAPATGSRPGDPNADLLFTFVMAKILKKIRCRANAAGISLEQPTQHGSIMNYAAWVDDVAFAVFGHAETIIDQTAALLGIIADTMTEHAMKLSLGPGKTAVLLEFHGPKATTERQKSERLLQNKLPLMSEHLGCTPVHLTNRYKYLGGFLVRGGGCLQEVQTRAACALQNIRPLKKYLSNPDIDVRHRRVLLRSMGLSIFTPHAGTWFALSQGEYRTWHAGLYKLYQQLQGRNEQGEVRHDDMYTLANRAQAPMAMELMYLSRLRLLFHLIKTADQFLIAAILYNHEVAGNDSWLYGATKSVAWLQQQLGSEAVPSELMDLHLPQTWMSFRDAHRELRKLLKQSEQAHLLRVQNLCGLRDHQRKQEDLLKAMNWETVEDVIPAEESHFCSDCSKSFKDQAALAAHQQRKHSQRVAMRFLAGDDTCKACKRKYHTRPRLILHLHHGSTRCWIWHLRKFHPMERSEVDRLGKQDRAKGVALHQHGFKDENIDKAWNRCENGFLAPLLACRTDESPSLDDPTPEELSRWSQIGLLPVGRGGRDKTTRQLQDHHIENVVRDTRQCETTLLDRLFTWRATDEWVPRPLATGTKYFLVLFSGHKRFGDISCWFEWGSNVQPTSLDLAIDEQFGDILQDSLWARLLHARKISGFYNAGASPRTTEDTERWCIWRSAFLRQLLLDKDFQLVTFLQGPLGRPFAKPTNLLAGRLHGLAGQLYAAYDPTWKPTQVLGGKKNGRWKTMQAKEYPVRMCEILAKAHMTFAEQIEEEGQEITPAGLADALQALCGHFDPYL
eukprot:s3046_g4.t1